LYQTLEKRKDRLVAVALKVCSSIIPQLFADGVDLIAIRQNIPGIKARVEGAGPAAPAVVYTELALWVVAFLGFLVAEVGLVVRRDRPLLAVSATDLITVGLLLIKPPVWVDGLITLGAWMGLWKTYWPNVLIGRRDGRKSSNNEKETQ